MQKKTKKQLLLALILFITTVSIGTSGYRILAPGTSFLNALYMTIITLTTIGYGEIVDLSSNPAGRIFTMVLIIFGMGNILFTATTITEFIINGEFNEYLIKREMKKMINKIHDHIILCGEGVIINKIIEELRSTKTPFIYICSNHAFLDEITDLYPGILYVKTDPSREESLNAAKITQAKGLICALPDDRDNIFIIVTAKKLNPTLRIIANANNPDNISKYKNVGVDSAISPNLIGGLRMVSEMIRPSVVTFLDIMMRDTSNNNRFSEININKGSELIGKSLKETNIREITGLLVVSMKDNLQSSFVYNPAPEAIIQEGSVLIVIGNIEQVESLNKLAHPSVP